MKNRRIVGMTAILMMATTVSAQAKPNLLFVVDSSGSMWGQLQGVTKMVTAKQALTRLIGDLSADISTGIMAYGHRRKNACDDVEMISPISPTSRNSAAAALDTLSPLGKTPIAYALQRAGEVLSKTAPGDTNNIVLISDGIETCGGDPCAVAAQLAAQNINVKVHVVGFDIAKQYRAQLQCIADNGNGKYFSANSTQGFTEAIKSVVKVVQAPKPAPEPVKQVEPEVFFFDDFNRNTLGDQWTIQNRDDDATALADGELLSIASGGAQLEKGNVINIFKLTQDMPKGNWVATMKFRMPYQTGRETPFLAIYDNKDNHIAAFANAWSYYEGTRGSRMYLSGQKLQKGKKTQFNKVIWGGASGQPFKMTQAPNPFILRITKKGRSYYPSVGFKVGGELTWVEHEKITSLRLKGKLAFGIYQAQKVNGETPMYVDWVKIERRP